MKRTKPWTVCYEKLYVPNLSQRPHFKSRSRHQPWRSKIPSALDHHSLADSIQSDFAHFLPLRIACHSALRLVGQEPEPSQATDMALACCFLNKVLGVGCRYFPPPLDIPTFAARYLYVCTTREILVAEGGNMSPVNLAEMTTSTPFWDLLNAVK